MNENIRELFKQTSLHRNDHTTEQRLAEIEKFAELIVRKCASICELNGASYRYSFTPAKARLAESTSKYCGTLINHHYGISE